MDNTDNDIPVSESSTSGGFYDAYKENSTIFSCTAEWLSNNISHILFEILQQKKSENVAVLGVGSFTGDQDIIIIDNINKILKKDVPIMYSAVDPCAPALDKFENVINEMFSEERGRLTFEKFTITFEAFMEENRPSTGYDFIHFIRCVNYLDAEKAFIHCFKEELRNSGKILIVLGTKDSCFKKISDKFRGKSLPCYYKNYHINTSEDLKHMAEKNSWKCESISSVDYEIDVTKCFNGSEEGDQIIEHFVKGEFRQYATPELREEVKKTLMELSTERNGRRIIYEANEAVVITKQL